jgi:putative tryptophan/tyrosine transport system ATP-binding protein
MLQISQIKKSFADHEILCGASFKAFDAKLTILEGQNGAGKSTLFNILVGNLAPDSGQIFLGHRDITRLKASERSHDIAILKQDPKASSAPALSVLENCAFALLKNRRAKLSSALNTRVKEQIEQHITSLGLNYEPQWNQPLGKLSGGQRQILAFAMATTYRPRLLLLDEPTAALDDASSHLLMKLIKKFVALWNIPAVMISHDHALNQAYGDVIFALKNGQIIEEPVGRKGNL